MKVFLAICLYENRFLSIPIAADAGPTAKAVFDQKLNKLGKATALTIFEIKEARFYVADNQPQVLMTEKCWGELDNK